MKTLFTIILVIFSLSLFAKKEISYGYHVVIDYRNETTVLKARSIDSLENIVLKYFPKSDINIKEMFFGSVYFEIRNYKMRFYVEKKRIINGTFRRLTKKEIKLNENKTN